MSVTSILRRWHIVNTDTLDKVSGKFEAENVTENISSTYARKSGLNRANPVTQFLHGNADTLSMQVRLYADHVAKKIDDQLDNLKSWVKRDSLIGRAPVLIFWMGRGKIYKECVLESITGLTHDRLTNLGGLRGATMTLNLVDYVAFEVTEVSPHETRYHRVKEGDYYELLAQREYGIAEYGDLVRRRHADKVELAEGQIVKLPSVSTLRRESRQPQSLPFTDAFVSRDTPTKTRREALFDARNVARVSHVQLEY